MSRIPTRAAKSLGTQTRGVSYANGISVRFIPDGHRSGETPSRGPVRRGDV
jgi:hypothetical protein